MRKRRQPQLNSVLWWGSQVMTATSPTKSHGESTPKPLESITMRMCIAAGVIMAIRLPVVIPHLPVSFPCNPLHVPRSACPVSFVRCSDSCVVVLF